MATYENLTPQVKTPEDSSRWSFKSLPRFKHPRSIELLMMTSGVSVVFGWTGILIDFWMIPGALLFMAVTHEVIAKDTSPKQTRLPHPMNVPRGSHRSFRSAPAGRRYVVSSLIIPRAADEQAHTDVFGMPQKHYPQPSHGLRFKPTECRGDLHPALTPEVDRGRGSARLARGTPDAFPLTPAC